MTAAEFSLRLRRTMHGAPFSFFIKRLRSLMSTPNPAPSILHPSFWQALGKTLAHDDLPIVVTPLRAVIAAMKAANGDPVKTSLAALAFQTGLASMLPSLAAQTEDDVLTAIDGQLAQIPAQAAG